MKSLVIRRGEVEDFLTARQEKGKGAVHGLKDFLRNLRYEGKFSLGKNIKEGEKAAKTIDQELKDHMRIGEKVLYPYVENHIPRMGALIQILKSEHENCRKSFLKFKTELKRFSKEKKHLDQNEALLRIHETGTYLVYLLKHHQEIEMSSLYRLISQELSAWEKKELFTAIKRLKERKVKL